MEKNALIAIVVSFLIIFVYYTFFAPVPAKKEVPQEKKEAAPKVVEQQPAPFQQVEPLPPGGPVVQTEGRGKKVTIETNEVIIVFDSQGGEPISWVLKDYKDQPGKKG